MSFSLKDKPNKAYPKAIPIADVKSLEAAKHLQVWFCKLTLDDRYIWPKFNGTLDHLNEVSEKVKATYEEWKEDGFVC